MPDREHLTFWFAMGKLIQFSSKLAVVVWRRPQPGGELVLVNPLRMDGKAVGQILCWQIGHRYGAVMEVLDGSQTSEVAVQYWVSMQSVYMCRDRYAARIDKLGNAGPQSPMPADP